MQRIYHMSPTPLHLQGSWNLRNAKFAEPGQLSSWAVASLVRKQEAEGANSLQVRGAGSFCMLYGRQSARGDKGHIRHACRLKGFSAALSPNMLTASALKPSVTHYTCYNVYRMLMHLLPLLMRGHAPQEFLSALYSMLFQCGVQVLTLGVGGRWTTQ